MSAVFIYRMGGHIPPHLVKATHATRYDEARILKGIGLKSWGGEISTVKWRFGLDRADGALLTPPWRRFP